MTNIKYGIGDVIEYRPFGGGVRHVRVDERDPEIKNGKPGFGGESISHGGVPISEFERFVWGYDDQIIRVVARRGIIEVVDSPELEQ